MGAAGFKAYAAFPVTARLFMGIVCAAGAGNMYGTYAGHARDILRR